MAGKQASLADITVSLNAVSLPPANINLNYAYDFKNALSVTGDPTYNSSNASFSTTSSLPAGLSLSSAGVLSGKPTATTTGSSFQVLASYKTKTGQQIYTIVVNGDVLEVAQIAAGGDHSCAITPAGGVKCWGQNGSGQLGNGTTTQSLTPVQVSGLTSGVISLSLGQSHTCAVTSSGGVKCWGNNYAGKLGDNSGSNRSTPVDVYGLTSGMVSVSAGQYSTCGVTTSGGVKCWGRNNWGQLGNNSWSNSAVPVDVVGLSSGVALVSMGYEHACAVTKVGAAKCWGNGGSGQLGHNSSVGSPVPVDVSGLSSGVTEITELAYSTCALVNGGVKCWGDGVLLPTAVAGLSGVSRITSGYAHTCVIAAGAAKCWGWNGNGALGNNSTNDNYSPDYVYGLSSGVATIAAGYFHTCAIMTSGAAKCWGANGNGQLGNNSTVMGVAPVDVKP